MSAASGTVTASYRSVRGAMVTPEVQRKLAAILCADVAGYSRMMGADDASTLAALSICTSIA